MMDMKTLFQTLRRPKKIWQVLESLESLLSKFDLAVFNLIKAQLPQVFQRKIFVIRKAKDQNYF